MKLWAAFFAFSLLVAGGDTGIFGRVTNAQTHEPVRRAAVKVYTSKEQWDQFTDGEGRFRFGSLVRGEYGLIAHRDGFTDRVYKVELSDFDDPKELPIELRPQGLITGKAIDGLGAPLQGARIEALNVRASTGSVQAAAWAETNDLGEYRLSGLDAGAYRLRATYRAGGGEFDSTPRTVATAFFGGTEKPTEVTVKPGSVAPGIDFVLTPVRPVRVRGTLRTEAGVLSEPVTLSIMGQEGEGGQNGSGTNGAFKIDNVGPGIYKVSAQTASKTARLFGTASVKVGESDVDGVEIMLSPSPKLEGKIRVEGGRLADMKIGSIFFSNLVQAGGIESAKPDEDGAFALPLNPGEYTIGFDSGSSDVLKVTFDDRPVTNWKIRMEPGAAPKKLLIVLKAKAEQ